MSDPQSNTSFVCYLFTAEYPYGKGETYLHEELKFLSKRFQRLVLVPTEKVSGEIRELPENCAVDLQNFELTRTEKVKALKGTLNEIYKSEKKWVKKRYGIKFDSIIRKTALVSLARGRKVKDYIDGLEKVDILYSYWANDAAIGLALSESSTKKVFRTHAWDADFNRSEAKYLPFRKLTVDRCDAIFPISETTRKICMNQWKVAGDKFEVQRLGVSDLKTKNLICTDVFTVVSCSALIGLKRVHLIGEALSKLHLQEQINWVHFGDGPQRKKLEAKAKSWERSKLQIDFRGHVGNEKLLSWYERQRKGRTPSFAYGSLFGRYTLYSNRCWRNQRIDGGFRNASSKRTRRKYSE